MIDNSSILTFILLFLFASQLWSLFWGTGKSLLALVAFFVILNARVLLLEMYYSTMLEWEEHVSDFRIPIQVIVVTAAAIVGVLLLLLVLITG